MHTLLYWHIAERRQIELEAFTYDEALVTAHLLWPHASIGWMRILDGNNKLVKLWEKEQPLSYSI